MKKCRTFVTDWMDLFHSLHHGMTFRFVVILQTCPWKGTSYCAEENCTEDLWFRPSLYHLAVWVLRCPSTSHDQSCQWVPSYFKSAIFKPLLKKPSFDPNSLQNYHPVCNLLFLLKIIKKVILSQLLDHPILNHLLSPNQSACGAGHSTETAVAKILNDSSRLSMV